MKTRLGCRNDIVHMKTLCTILLRAYLAALQLRVEDCIVCPRLIKIRLILRKKEREVRVTQSWTRIIVGMEIRTYILCIQLSITECIA